MHKAPCNGVPTQYPWPSRVVQHSFEKNVRASDQYHCNKFKIQLCDAMKQSNADAVAGHIPDYS